MKRLLKWSSITFLLLLIIVIILPFLFKDKIIAIAKEEMNKNLNATVTFGDFDLSLFSSFPDFRFTLKDLTVVGKGVFEKDTLAKLPELKLDLNLMSVISGDQYKINAIKLEKPRILAKVLPDGKANWDITIPSTDTAATSAPVTESKFAMSLKSLEINNGYIVYDDAPLVTKTILDGFTYAMSGDFTESLFLMKNDISISKFTIAYDGVTYLSKVNTKAKADLDMDMNKMRFEFKDNEFGLNELGFSLTGFFAMPGDDYDMDIKFAAKQAEFKSFLSLIPGAFTADFADVKTTGKLAFDAYAKGLYSEKQNKIPAFGLNFSVADGSFKYPAVPKSVTDINIDCKIANATGVDNDTKIDVNKFHLNFGGNPVDAELHVATPVSDASLNGWVKGKLNLATMQEFVPLEKGEQLTGIIGADVKMKGRMSQIEKEQYDQFDCQGTVTVENMLYKTATDPYDMNINAMNLMFSPQFVELKSFNGKMGKTDISANGRIDNLMTYLFKDSLLTGVFTMKSNYVDLNQFTGEEETETAPAAIAEEEMSVIEVPGNINFTMNSTIGKLIYDDMTIDNVDGQVVIKDKAVKLSNLKMNLMGGSMVMSGFYNTVNPMVPKVNFNMDITDFDIQNTAKTFNTVKSLAPVAEKTTGKFSSSLQYEGDLDAKMMPIMSTVNGKGSLSASQVVIDGFEPLKEIDEALKLNKFKKVTFSDIKNLSFTIKNGDVTTDPFEFMVGKSKAKMGGSTNLDQTINYVLDLAIPRNEFGPGNTALTGMVNSAQAKGIPVQLGDVVNVSALIGGTVTNPTVKTNLKEAAGNMMDQLKDNVTAVVTQKVDSLKDVGKEKARAEADKILADAQKRSDDLKAKLYKQADDAKTAAYAEADKVEKSYKNPLEKAAKKAAADAMRKKADDANKAAKAEADKQAQKNMDDARKEADAKLK